VRRGYLATGRDAAEEGVGELQHDSGAIARLRIAAGGATMSQTTEHLKTLLDDLVRPSPIGARDEAKTARAAFVCWVVKR
jgi:hypothetical protein